MKTEPQPRQHHEGEAPPEPLVHHDEPTMLEQWLRGLFQKGTGFWLGVVLVVGGLAAAAVIALRVGGPSRSGLDAWNELAAVGVAPSSDLSSFGPDPNAGLPERLKEIAEAHPETLAARWAALRAASILLNEGSTELASSRRSAGAGKIVEADELFNRVFDETDDETVRRMAALGRARAAEARLGLDADDTDHAQLDEVLPLYEAVVDDFPETPEADQAARLLRRLRRSDSIAFYEELSRYSPSSVGSGLPGFDLAPGGSAPLDGIFGPSGGGLPGGLGLPGGSGFPSGPIPAPGSGSGLDLDGLDLSPSLDVDSPTDPAMPAPVTLPDSSGEADAPDAPAIPAPDAPGPDAPPSETPDVPVAPEPAPVDPAPSPAPADSPGETPAPAPESPQVPADPFGGTPSPSPEPAPADTPPPGDNR